MPIDLLLETPDVAPFDAVSRWGRRRRGGDLRLRDEQLVLEPDEERAELRGPGGQGLLGNPEVGAELVERAERLDPLGVLQYAGTTSETGLAAVTGAGV